MAWAVALAALGAPWAQAQTEPFQAPAPEGDPLRLRFVPLLSEGPQAGPSDLPTYIDAQTLQSGPDQLDAQGEVSLTQGRLNVQADTLRYQSSTDQAQAEGHVRIERDGNVFEGPKVTLGLQSFEGQFVAPRFQFTRVGAGGRADRIDFLGGGRLRAWQARYTSCRLDDPQDEPAWELRADEITLDPQGNSGEARGAVLRFMGVPILGGPWISFPVTDARKSGWLPPTFTPYDSRSGARFQLPYYWNIAPHTDATFSPVWVTRRGLGLDTAWRYLHRRWQFSTLAQALPQDRQTGSDRWALTLQAQGQWAQHKGQWALETRRVSDDDYWRDFPRLEGVQTPRLLSQHGQVQWNTRWGRAWVEVQRWQTLADLQSGADLRAPYQRVPRVGLLWDRDWPGWGGASLRTEYTRFDLSEPDGASSRPTGHRGTVSGEVRRTYGGEGHGWLITPRLALHGVAYRLDQALTAGDFVGRRQVQRLIPTLSVDARWMLDRPTQWFGQTMTQTLEPRLRYTWTPYVAQNGLPKFDTAYKDAGASTLFDDNGYAGQDRRTDTHALTFGAVTRWIRPQDGAEWARLGVVQRYALQAQRITEEVDGRDGLTPIPAQFSDVYLYGSTQWLSRWSTEGSVQYSPAQGRTLRTSATLRYSPGPFRTVTVTYRLVRQQSEQLEWAWQWPLAGMNRQQALETAAQGAPSAPAAGTSGSACSGRWMGAGKLVYNHLDRRVTSTLLGLEYDSACWAARVVAERQSTSRSEVTTRVMLQLELVGLSRLGANALGLLRDNVPGYRMLRESPRNGPF